MSVRGGPQAFICSKIQNLRGGCIIFQIILKLKKLLNFPRRGDRPHWECSPNFYVLLFMTPPSTLSLVIGLISSQPSKKAALSVRDIFNNIWNQFVINLWIIWNKSLNFIYRKLSIRTNGINFDIKLFNSWQIWWSTEQCHFMLSAWLPW